MCSRSLKAVDGGIKRAGNAIGKPIQTDTELRRLFTLVASVGGIGKVAAVQIIVATNEFRDISSPKKFACYAGAAPFEPKNRACSRARPGYRTWPIKR